MKILSVAYLFPSLSITVLSISRFCCCCCLLLLLLLLLHAAVTAAAVCFCCCMLLLTGRQTFLFDPILRWSDTNTYMGSQQADDQRVRKRRRAGQEGEEDGVDGERQRSQQERSMQPG